MTAVTAPIPGSFIQDECASVPIAPPLPEHIKNLDKKDRYWIHVKGVSHGKQWIAACLEKRGIIAIDTGFLPNDKCIFYWNQREETFAPEELFSTKELYPCIAFVPSQKAMCDKLRFAELLHGYYGDDAWDITPLTLPCYYDELLQTWDASKSLQQQILSKQSNHVWVTKSTFGSCGSGVFLFRGNTMSDFLQFINSKYRTSSSGTTASAKPGYKSRDDASSIIVQQYIDKPLLYDKAYKFDLRVYSLVACSNPCILFYHIGKMRVCGVKYNDLRYLSCMQSCIPITKTFFVCCEKAKWTRMI